MERGILDVIMTPSLSEDLKNSLFDGAFANMFATLTGGLFLTGLALFLGMNELMIGLLSAAPFLATIFQVPTSYFLETSGERKKYATRAAAAARLLWLPVLVIVILPEISLSTKSIIVLGMIFISHVFISISYVSWLSWISDIVPENIRGRFFGSRNMLCGAAGMLTMLIFGFLLDWLKNNALLQLGFGITLISAVGFGIQSVIYLTKISEPPAGAAYRRPSEFWHGLSQPFRNRNFRNLIFFSFAWSFSVYLSSPFFTLYFIRDLKFSYGFVAVLGSIAALSDLLGMQVWGRISDRVKNKAVIQFTSWVVVFLPIAWASVRPDSFFIPILLQVIGGGFWAGMNLCTNNLLFGITPPVNKSYYLSAYNIAAGLGAAVSPVMAGLFLKHMVGFQIHIHSFAIQPLYLLFFASTFLRILAALSIRTIQEPEEVHPYHIIRIIRNVRAINIASGFNYLLHPFIDISEVTGKNDVALQAGVNRCASNTHPLKKGALSGLDER